MKEKTFLQELRVASFVVLRVETKNCYTYVEILKKVAKTLRPIVEEGELEYSLHSLPTQPDLFTGEAFYTRSQYMRIRKP